MKLLLAAIAVNGIFPTVPVPVPQHVAYVASAAPAEGIVRMKSNHSFDETVSCIRPMSPPKAFASSTRLINRRLAPKRASRYPARRLSCSAIRRWASSFSRPTPMRALIGRCECWWCRIRTARSGWHGPTSILSPTATGLPTARPSSRWPARLPARSRRRRPNRERDR